jgi:hypothetical protein
VEQSALADIRAEPGFVDEVVREMGPWKVRGATDIKAAILNNALDAKRDDQWLWIKRYASMVKADFLPDEDE